MKLQEKFIDFVYCFMGSGMLTNTYDEAIAEWNAKECEKIADAYSIQFYNWMQDNYYQVGDGFVSDRNMDESKRVIITTETALKNYKKEYEL